MNVKHLMARMTVVAALVAGAGVGTAIDAMATSQPIGTVMVTTQRMAGPTLNTTQYGSYAAGSRLALVCYARGQSVRGYYSWAVGLDNLWYRTTDGGWVADIDVSTNSNSAVTGACVPASTTTKAQRALSWANAMIGSNAYYGLCETLVEHSYGTAGRFPSAMAAFYNLRAAGQMHYNSTNIPAGALVFSSNPRYDSGFGHVMLSRGDGSYVSGGAGGPSVRVFYTANPGSTFLGWSYPPASWPGR